MRPTARETHEAGVRLTEYAAEFKRRKPLLSDNEAFRLAILANPRLGQQYTGQPVRSDGADDVLSILYSAYSGPQYFTAIDKLAAIVESTPKLFNQPVDWSDVIRRVQQHPDVLSDASKEVFNKLVDNVVAQNAGNRLPHDRKYFEGVIKAQYNDLALMLDNPANVNERALRYILSQRV
jgi:hypothetical protein